MSRIICPNCGGEYDAGTAKCPYCDYINPEAAEDKFFEKLEEKRENLSDLPETEEVKGAYGREVSENAGRAAKKIITAAVVIAVIAAGICVFRMIIDSRLMKEAPEAFAKELAWQNEHFAELDELYAADEFDKLAKLYSKYEDEGHDMWTWKHSAFLETRSMYNDLMSDLDEIEKSGCSRSLAELMVYDAFYLYYTDYSDIMKDEKDLEMVEAYRTRAAEALHDRFAFTDSQLQSFRSSVYKDGFVSWKECEKIAHKYYKNFK